MTFDATLAIVVTALVAAGSMVLSLAAWFSARRWQARAADYQAALSEMRQDVRGLCAGAVGLDDRLARIEQSGRRLKERQEQLELRDNGERLYTQAIRMVHKGAGAEELISVCGLSRNEAELILMMHSVDKAG